MTGSCGVKSPPSPKARSSVAYCKLYATLPDNAPRVLIKDSIYLDHPASAWPQRRYERRRLFENVYHRYFRQILYGCKNSKCDTPTCLSRQRRVSRGPFRRFTVLSARSLATFLASQDNPEKGLCPYEPNATSEPRHSDPLATQSDKKRRSNAGNAGSKDAPQSNSGGSYMRNIVNFDLTEDQPPEVMRDVESRDSAQQEDLRNVKDPKSFTQNLFDTIAMMVLQKVRVPNELGLLKWATFVRGEEGNEESEEFNGELMFTESASAKDSRSCYIPKDNGRVSPEWDDTEIIAEGSSGLLSMADAGASFECHEKRKTPSNGSGVMAGISESNERTCSSITTARNGSQCHPQVLQILSGSQTIEEGHIVNDVAVPTFTRPQTLSHFTSENIRSMVSMIKNANPIAHEERKFIHSLGRAEEPVHPKAMVVGDATSQDMVVVYGIQSIINVLGNAKALLHSFRYTPPANSSASNIPSIGFKEISGAFRTLKEVDYHPSNIFPSLWNSVGSLYLPGPTRSKSPVGKFHPPRSAKDSDSEPRLHHKRSVSKTLENSILSDAEAAHVAKIALAALVASVPACSSKAWLYIQTLRASGKAAPITNGPPRTSGTIDDLLEIIDSLDNELSLALMTRLVKAIAARLCVSEISRNQGLSSGREVHSLHGEKDILEMILDSVWGSNHTNPLSKSTTGVSDTSREPTVDSPYNPQPNETPEISPFSIIVEWLRSVVLREWDGKPEVPRWGAVGGALEFLSYIYRHCRQFKLDPEIFHTPSLSERFDVMEMPADWLSAPTDRRLVYMLSYSFLFRPSTLVTYFRSINHAAMSKAFEASMVASRLFAEMRTPNHIDGRGEPQVSEKIRRAMNSYLVLEIRRDRVLTDAINQLWRRERRELLRPLKVRLGVEEGEEGLDHGGVQQEFFHVAIGEALNPDYGLFRTDMQTRTSWFQPCPLEPLYKFEMLGLLTSLAIYNGLTLPITFPLALYRKLLDLPVTRIAHIEDGWPDLAKGFKELLTWTNGDVEDVFVRSYIFSVEGLGTTIDVNMDRAGEDADWPPINDNKVKEGSTVLEDYSIISSQSSRAVDGQVPSSFQSQIGGVRSPDAGQVMINPSAEPWSQDSALPRTDSIKPEAGMVTNANREQYVQDYIFWLTDKSIRPQFEAFARGFYMCLDRKATTVFTPEALKSVVEGIQEIDVDALQQTTRYEGGFSAEHRVIKDFWHVVRQFSPEKLRLLLEFVTASDRIPVNGVRSILFVIQQNGVDDERLPTSLTCFGRLLLPAYSTKKKLKEKLCAAIENSKGFGVA